MTTLTPAQLRKICDSLNDKRGTGGQTRLAELMGLNPSTIRRKLAGTSPIMKSDVLAITLLLGIKRFNRILSE